MISVAPWLVLSVAVIAQLPPSAAQPIDFTRDIKPILQVSCVRCHGRGREPGGFSIETRELLLKGGDDGPALVPGKSAESHLIALVAGLDPDEVMPKKGSRLTTAQIGLLRAWIDQGAAVGPRRDASRGRRRGTSPARARAAGDAPTPRRIPVDRLLHGVLRGARTRRRATQSTTAVHPPRLARLVGVLPSPVEVRDVRGRHARRTSASGSSRACSPTTAGTPSTG